VDLATAAAQARKPLLTQPTAGRGGRERIGGQRESQPAAALAFELLESKRSSLLDLVNLPLTWLEKRLEGSSRCSTWVVSFAWAQAMLRRRLRSSMCLCWAGT